MERLEMSLVRPGSNYRWPQSLPASKGGLISNQRTCCLPAVPCGRPKSFHMECSTQTTLRIQGSMGGGPGGGDGLEKVRQLLGQANSEDSRKGFGPPPPSDADAGSGFINLFGREELLAGSRKFSEPAQLSGSRNSSRSLPKAVPGDGSGESRETDPSGGTEPSSSTDEPVPGSVSEDHKRTRKGFLLPTPLTPPQRISALGLLGLTVVAFGKSSQDVVPEDLLSFLQGWMRLAWGAHAVLGLVAAGLAPGKGQPRVKWFVKVLTTGTLGFVEFWELPSSEQDSKTNK